MMINQDSFLTFKMFVESLNPKKTRQERYMALNDMSPKSRDASIDRFLTRLGALMDNQSEMRPLEVFQRTYVIWDEEVGQRG